MLERIKRAIKTVKVKRGAPLHIEFNLTDFCNLNCVSCSHYSPLAEEKYEGLDVLERDMAHLSGLKNARLIEGVYLIGGETLLYPRLTEAMRMARKYFGWAKISIFTNGLLIPKMSEEFWDTCRETNCVIALTRYPIKYDYDRVEAIVRDKGVALEVFGDRREDNSFFRFPLDRAKKQRGLISHFKCFSFGCITIEYGKIFPCPQSACVGHLNRKFGTEFKWEKGDYLEVSSLTDARQLLKFRNRPVPFCGYCKHHEVITHRPSRRSSSEWIS